MYQPDATDLKILRVLQDNSNLTNKRIAELLGMSTTPVFERIKRMERAGIIQRYVAIVDRKYLGYRQTIFIGITLKGHTREFLDRFVAIIDGFEEVMECHRVSGDYDYLLKVVVKNIEAYEEFILNKLTMISDLGSVQSLIVLSTSKETTSIQL